MKQFISIVCIVLMLTVLLVGCGRNKNVSDNTDGMITESTRPTTVAPTTERPTTERPTTERPTTQQPTTESTSASVGGSETNDATDNNTDPSESIEGRMRRGIMGNQRY